MAPLRTGARDDGTVEFATPDRSLPRTDSTARLIPELRSRNISSFRAGWVERAGKSLGKPIILEPAALVRSGARSAGFAVFTGGRLDHEPVASHSTCFGDRPAPILTEPHSGSWSAALMDTSQRHAGPHGGEADVEARGTATAWCPGQHRADTIPPIRVA